MRSRLPQDFPRRELILQLAARLTEHPAVERVWLFGSRARGDNFERSDIDLAIEAPSMDHYDWLNLSLDFGEEVDTLLLIDLVRLDELPERFQQRVLREGIVLYGPGSGQGHPRQPGQRSGSLRRGPRSARP